LEDNNFCQFLSAPSLAQVAKWLREEKEMHIAVNLYRDYSNDADGRKCEEWVYWGFDVIIASTGAILIDGDGEFETYESALSTGIDVALELLMPEEKNNVND